MKLWPRNRGQASGPTIHIEFTDAPEPPEPEFDDEAWDVEMAVPLARISALFAEHGWALARPGQGTQPSPVELAALITECVIAVSEHPGGSWFPMARFLTVVDDAYPDDVDIYLNIGTATRREPVEDSEEADEID